MAKFRCQRQVSRCGGSTYIPVPRQAMLDLRLFFGDWVEIELDTETHVVTLRPLQWRAVAPQPGPRQNPHDMVPDELSTPRHLPRRPSQQQSFAEVTE